MPKFNLSKAISYLGLFFIASAILSFSTQQEKNISVTMPVSKWNTVLDALSKLPYDKAAPIIETIQFQASKQLTDTIKKK